MDPSLGSGTWVTFAAGAPATLHVRRFRLVALAGPDAGKSFELEADLVRLGARATADVRLADPRVSGLHAELLVGADGYRVRDLGSTNGTFIGDLRVAEAWLAPGAVVRLGDTELRFEPLAEAAAVALSPADRFGPLVGRSTAMRRLFALLERLAPTPATVLVHGETGTGKELVAQALHERSPRADGPLEVLDCGALPPSLIESELFGHERGAFTGAATARAGVFERAHGGTLFLDEIGELPLDLQPKLLRVLERRELRRLGGTRTISVDLRVVAATHRDLAVEVERGRFREDLYYRLAVAVVRVPALRERPGDLEVLVEHFLGQLGGTRLAPETLAAFLRHDWPGNVRELRNAVERAVLALGDPLASGRGAAPAARAARPAPPAAGGSGSEVGEVHATVDLAVPFKDAKAALVEEFERLYVGALLDKHAWNFSAAAREAGVDRMAIHKIVQRLGLTAPK